MCVKTKRTHGQASQCDRRSTSTSIERSVRRRVDEFTLIALHCCDYYSHILKFRLYFASWDDTVSNVSQSGTTSGYFALQVIPSTLGATSRRRPRREEVGRGPATLHSYRCPGPFTLKAAACNNRRTDGRTGARPTLLQRRPRLHYSDIIVQGSCRVLFNFKYGSRRARTSRWTVTLYLTTK